MAGFGEFTVKIDLEPSDKVRELIRLEVRKQLAEILAEIQMQAGPRLLTDARLEYKSADIPCKEEAKDNG